jgi:hypothetical protein
MYIHPQRQPPSSAHLVLVYTCNERQACYIGVPFLLVKQVKNTCNEGQACYISVPFVLVKQVKNTGNEGQACYISVPFVLVKQVKNTCNEGQACYISVPHSLRDENASHHLEKKKLLSRQGMRYDVAGLPCYNKKM